MVQSEMQINLFGQLFVNNIPACVTDYHLLPDTSNYVLWEISANVKTKISPWLLFLITGISFQNYSL